MPVPDPRKRAQPPAHRARGRRAEPDRPAVGLPVPHPLLEGRRTSAPQEEPALDRPGRRATRWPATSPKCRGRVDRPRDAHFKPPDELRSRPTTEPASVRVAPRASWRGRARWAAANLLCVLRPPVSPGCRRCCSPSYSSIHVLVCSTLIVLILLHSGKGGGLSDMFGGGLGASAAGSTVVEKNLDRITLVAAHHLRLHVDLARPVDEQVGPAASSCSGPSGTADPRWRRSPIVGRCWSLVRVLERQELDAGAGRRSPRRHPAPGRGGLASVGRHHRHRRRPTVVGPPIRTPWCWSTSPATGSPRSTRPPQQPVPALASSWSADVGRHDVDVPPPRRRQLLRRVAGHRGRRGHVARAGGLEGRAVPGRAPAST